MILQLDPQIPVSVAAGPGWAGPTGPGQAVGWVDQSAEHNLIWVVLMDATGECWCVPNPFVRGRRNVTTGRTFNSPSPDDSIG